MIRTNFRDKYLAIYADVPEDFKKYSIDVELSIKI